jgi:membrane-bound acyltransferase YfiQ involved in biofilm formation
MKILKSIGAVLAGFIVVAVLSTLTDYILETAGIFPLPGKEKFDVTWMILLALVYRTAYTILGGYITAKLAPYKPMAHVWVLAIIGLLGALAGLIATWNMDLGPRWYPLALLILAIPSVWLGGWLQECTNKVA